MIIIHSEQFMNDKDIKQIEILKSFLKFCKCQSSKLWNDIFAEVRNKKKSEHIATFISSDPSMQKCSIHDCTLDIFI